MSVEQRARTAAVAVFPDHDRMPGGRANADVEAERAEILGEMLRRLPALVPIRRIGRDRANAQEAEQPLEAAVEILVDPVEDLVELAHGLSPPGWAR